MHRLRSVALFALLASLSDPTIAVAQTRAATSPAAKPRLTKPPQLLEFVEATYPESEASSGREATVVLAIAIAADGSVSEAAVLESAGEAFDAAALEAARKFRFSPAEIDDQPAPVKITYRYQFTQRVVAPTTGGFRGVVLAKGTGQPLVGVTVEVAGVGSRVTDEAGAFAFDELEPGTFRISLSRADLTTLQTEELVEAGHTIEARYDVELPSDEDEDEDEKDDFEVVVRAPRLVKQVVSTEVSADEARRLPGTQGDVLKVVENLPGVARAAAGSSGVVVWGAAPEDTRTYVGAVRIPMLYHFGGLRSVLHGDRVQSVELIPGGYGAPYGRGLGGLVLVKERPTSEDRLRGSLQADLLDASVAASAPLGERTSFAVSARKSYIKELSTLLEDQSFQQFFTLPEYYDGSARLRHVIDDTQSIELGGLLSGDTQTRTQPSSDPARRVQETRSLTFQRVDVTYRKRLDDGSQVELTPWYGHDDSRRAANFGGVPSTLQSESHLVGLRSEWRGRITDALTGTAGLDFELVSSETRRSGSVTSPSREGDPYVFGRIPADTLNTDDWKTVIVSAAPYAQVDWALLNETLHVTPGVRVEPYLLSVNRRVPSDPAVPDRGQFTNDVSVQPRLSVRYSPEPRVTFKGAFGLYRQPPLPDDLSAIFGNPLLGVSKGQHYLLGASYRLHDVVTVEATLFHTQSQELVARNSSTTPRVGQALLQEGEGRSLGAQFLLRKDKGESRFFGWVAYTILRSERRATPNDDWRLFDFDQTHVLTALAAYDIGAGFEVGLRARLASGYPRTPVIDAYFDTSSNRYEPVLGAYNTTRIPMFFQVDARVTKTFKFDTSELEVYLDVQNAMNRSNPEEIAYSPDYGERRYILGLPILPVLGARYSF